MNPRTWSLPAVLVLALATCQGANPTDPIGGDDIVDPWRGTAWASRFQEAKDMGGRADLVVKDQRFGIRPSAYPEQWVFAEPACSVSGRPGVKEVRHYLKCLNDQVLGDPDRMKYDAFGEPIRGRWERKTYIIKWEPAEGVWHVWTTPGWTCGNAYWAAENAGRIRLM